MDQRKGTSSKRRTGIILVVLLVFAASVGMTIRQRTQYRQIAEDRAEAARIANLPEPDAQAPGDAASAQPAPSPAAMAEPQAGEAAAIAGIDLDALRAVNEDITGWIVIPGTELSYPLVQGTDNQYYLSHNWKREASSGGSVFLESTNSRDLTGFHTIIYAHRMRNDTMFGTLKYYADLDYWQEHPSVYVVLDSSIFRYDIFSAQEAGVKGIVYRLDIEENQLKEEFLQYCTENSAIDTGLAPGPDDRILTLSTCTSSGHATRWVVHGVLAQEYSRGLPEG